MFSFPPWSVMLAVLAGSVVAIILEAAGEPNLLSRLLAHAVGAVVTLLLGDYGFPTRALHADPILSYLVQPNQLLFVVTTSMGSTLVDSALGRHLFASLIVHATAYLVGLSLLH